MFQGDLVVVNIGIETFLKVALLTFLLKVSIYRTNAKKNLLLKN